MNAIFLLKNKGDVSFLYEDCTVRQGLEKMKAHGFTAIPVISHDGDYVGSISEGDFLWHIMDSKNNDIKAKEEVLISKMMRTDFNPAVRIDVSMEELLDKAKRQNFVPVVDDRHKFIGIITRKDIIAYFQTVYEDDELNHQTSKYRATASTVNI